MGNSSSKVKKGLLIRIQVAENKEKKNDNGKKKKGITEKGQDFMGSRLD